MKTVYKAHILFTKEKDRFEVYENGYIAVENGKVLYPDEYLLVHRLERYIYLGDDRQKIDGYMR